MQLNVVYKNYTQQNKNLQILCGKINLKILERIE